MRLLDFSYFDFASMSPATDPTRATTDTTIKTPLNISRTTHFLLQDSTLRCTIYISTGKYMANGHRFNAPNTPKISLKYGNTNAIPVVDAT